MSAVPKRQLLGGSGEAVLLNRDQAFVSSSNTNPDEFGSTLAQISMQAVKS